jgi:hypothetical protein
MTGREGTTAVALPASQKIANGSTGLTIPPAIAFMYSLVGRIIVLSSSTVDNNAVP